MAAAAGVGGGSRGGEMGWNFGELDCRVDRGAAGRRSSVRLFKIFGSSKVCAGARICWAVGWGWRALLFGCNMPWLRRA